MRDMQEAPPQDIEAERAVLAAVLLDETGSVIDALSGVLTPADFFRPENGRVFEAALALHGDRVPIDIVTLGAKLREMGAFNAIGGAQYLGDLTDEIPTIAHVIQHAAQVRETARDREVMEVAQALLHTRDRKVKRALSERLNDLTTWDVAATTVKTMGELLECYFEDLANAAENRRQLYWPFPTLRRWAKGPQPGNLITIAARPGRGKSVLGEQLAIEFAKQIWQSGDTAWGVGLFIALEMSHLEFGARALAAEAQVNHDYTSKIQAMTPDVFQKVTQAANRLYDLPLVVDDKSSQSLASIVALARKLKRERGLAFIVVDYLQLMDSSGMSDEKRQQFIGKITRGLKVMAGDMGIPIIELAQMNRNVESRSNGIPILADLREAGDIEQDSSGVMFLADGEKREGVERGHGDFEEMRLVVAKMRGGRTGIIDIVFQKSMQRIVEKTSDADGAVENRGNHHADLDDFASDVPFDGGEVFDAEIVQQPPPPPPRGPRKISGGGFTASPDEE